MRTLVVAILALHVGAGTVAIGGGLVALVTTKGARVHRGAGRVFSRSMLAVIASAAVLALASWNVYFAALTIGAAAPAFSGVRVLRRKRAHADPLQRATALDWSVSVVIFTLASALLMLAWMQPATRNRGLVFALAGAAVAHMLYDLWRFTFPTRWPSGPDVWLFEHIVRMLAAYFAALAAFSGSVLVLFDPPWRQLWAVILGQWLTLMFLFRYRHGLNRGPVAAPSIREAA
jgi:hypothetical protein